MLDTQFNNFVFLNDADNPLNVQMLVLKAERTDFDI